MDLILDEQNELKSSKPRSSFVIFIFSLFLPGMGHVYLGQAKKGIILLSILFLIPFVFGLVKLNRTFAGMIAMIMLILLFRLYVIIDAIRLKRKLKPFEPKKYNTWYFHLLIAILFFTGLYFLRVTTLGGIQAFSIPTSSGIPTIQIGDKVVADMRIYDKSSPDYGDLVLFRSPQGEFWFFRVVGLPGDTLKVENDLVKIHGKSVRETFLRDSVDENDSTRIFEETLPNGHTHLIQMYRTFQHSRDTSVRDIVVPRDSYYLLGDNRDNAADSRYIGFVPKADLRGKILYSYFGKTLDRININFTNQ